MSEINSVVEKIKKLGGDKVKFIILYGSQSTNKQTPLSDVDLAVFYDGSKEERFRFRMKILGRVPEKYDIQLFQDLPLYVKNEVIKGKVVYNSDTKLIYKIAKETYQAFDDFKKRFYDYVKGDVIR
ncbi:MAG: nucleotidyltransferase domain-containing protein [Candidatus Thermoplasmatota archaeon]